jgi:hypothetical protein
MFSTNLSTSRTVGLREHGPVAGQGWRLLRGLFLPPLSNG